MSSPHTLQELAEQIEVTRERVRQIELRVLGTVEKAIGPEIQHYLNPSLRAAQVQSSKPTS